MLYLAARPVIAARVSGLRWIEFPVAVALLGLALALAMRTPRQERALVPEWRRHQQVVRALPDPELAPLEAALSAWLESGEQPERAAGILARATNASLDDLREAMTRASTRRDRLRLLTQAIHRS